MKLIPNWRALLKYALSVRILAAAVVLSGAEAVVPYLDTLVDITPRRFALIMCVTCSLATIARFKAQKQITCVGVSAVE